MDTGNSLVPARVFLREVVPWVDQPLDFVPAATLEQTMSRAAPAATVVVAEDTPEPTAADLLMAADEPPTPVPARYAIVRVGGGYAKMLIESESESSSDSEPDAPPVVEAAVDMPAATAAPKRRRKFKFMMRTATPASVSCGLNFCVVVDTSGAVWSWYV